jgi:signal transduction histidine kinase/ActR/RegA family two-component response regulator
VTVHEIIALLGRLAEATRRAEAARSLAAAIGASEVVVLVSDADLGILVPGPGFAQTLAGGPAWRALLGSSPVPGRKAARLPPASGAEPVEALLLTAADGTTLVALGGVHDQAAAELVEASLPLLGAALRAEQRAATAAGMAALALRRADERKDEFLAMLAHELRNPLSPIVTALHLIYLHIEAKEPFDRELQVIGRQLANFTRLVDDLLDVSRITQGKIELRRENVPLSAVIDRALESAEPALRTRRQRLEVDLPEAPIVLQADPVRLAQVVANLLGNASKYTAEGGSIAVRAHRGDSAAEIEVEDDGIGITADLLPRVFDLFSQAPQALDRTQGGLGIGLTVSRALVELHGGTICAESGGVGKGSRFTVRLPLANGEATRGLEVSADELPRKPLRVLVVDDNGDAAQMLSEALRLWGHSVSTACEGAEALRIAAESVPQVILLDVGLPGMNGYQVAQRLRERRSRAWIVGVSGYGTPEDKRQAQAAGFDQYLVKPVELRKLRALLAAAPPDPTPC